MIIRMLWLWLLFVTFICASYWSWIADTCFATMPLTCAWSADINSAGIDMMRKAEAKSQWSVTLLLYHASEKCTRAAFLAPKFKVSQVLKTFISQGHTCRSYGVRSHLFVPLARASSCLTSDGSAESKRRHAVDASFMPRPAHGYGFISLTGTAPKELIFAVPRTSTDKTSGQPFIVEADTRMAAAQQLQQ